MAEAKHEFIDDNPYIVYTGKPDTAYDGDNGGGGGGGGAESLICEYNEGYLNKTVGEIYNAFANGQAVIYHANVSEGEDTRSGDWASLNYISINGNSVDGFYATIEFYGASFFTDTESTVDAVFALYPTMSD